MLPRSMADVGFEGGASRGGFKTGMKDMVVEFREAMAVASTGSKPELSRVEAGCVPPLGGVCPMGDVADCKSERMGDVN